MLGPCPRSHVTRYATIFGFVCMIELPVCGTRSARVSSLPRTEGPETETPRAVRLTLLIVYRVAQEDSDED